MALPLIQLLLCISAGLALFLLWRRHVAPARLGWIVTAGFLIRAFAGTLLFWISWLELPLFRSLQSGPGLWFFALDAYQYLPPAFLAADQGLVAIVTHMRTVASVTFVQTLALFAYCFGSIPSVALLLNLFAFLGSSIIVLRLSSAAETPGNRAIAPRALALIALSLPPSAILWSLQPLKDTLFQFLIVGFVGAAAVWQRAWRSSKPLLGASVAAALMVSAIYTLAGIRWYYAFVVLLASGVCLPLVALQAERRKWVAVASALALFVVATQAFRYGGGPYLPNDIARVVTPATFLSAGSALPQLLDGEVERARSAFESGGGATMIRSEQEITTKEEPQFEPQAQPLSPAKTPLVLTEAPDQGGASSPREPAPEPSTSSVEASPRIDDAVVAPASPAGSTALAEVPSTAPALATTASPVAEVASPSPALETPATSTALVPEAPPPASDPAPRESAAEPPPIAEDSPVDPSQDGLTNPEPLRVEPSLQEPVPMTPKADAILEPSTSVAKPETSIKERTSRAPTADIADRPPPQPPAAPAALPANTEAQPEDGGVNDGELVIPSSRGRRLLTGLAAMILPQSLAQGLGIMKIGGGRGLMWFTDLDTVFFDAILLASMLTILLRLRAAAPSNGVFWLLVLVAILITPALVYAVTNYGTLFRLRAMVFIAFALIPVALLTHSGDVAGTATPEARAGSAPSDVQD